MMKNTLVKIATITLLASGAVNLDAFKVTKNIACTENKTSKSKSYPYTEIINQDTWVRKINDTTKTMPATEKNLFLAAYNGDINLIKNCLSLGGNINSQDAAGKTPLMYALGNDHTATVEFLIKSGANVNVQDSNGETALMLAHNLIRTKIEVFSKTDNNATFESLLSKRTVQALLDAPKIKLYLRNASGKTVIDMAKFSLNFTVAHLILNSAVYKRGPLGSLLGVNLWLL